MQTSGKLRSLRAENSLNSRAASVLPSSMKAHVSAKSDVGWRFAPACCAAQSVPRARAQERRAKVSDGAVSWDSRCTEPIRWSSASRRRRRSIRPTVSASRTNTSQRKTVAQFKSGASNGFNLSAVSSRVASLFQPFQVEAVLANHSLNRTRNGRRCKPAVLRL